jgi:hypothetical protein
MDIEKTEVKKAVKGNIYDNGKEKEYDIILRVKKSKHF